MIEQYKTIYNADKNSFFFYNNANHYDHHYYDDDDLKNDDESLKITNKHTFIVCS